MSCTPSQTISTDTPGQVITGTVLDKAGKQGTASVTLKIDTTPPVVTLFTAPNQLSPGQSGTATLSATDNIGITSVVFSLNGTAISTLSGPPYTTNVTVPTTANPGDTLTLTATVSDAVGNAFSPSSHGILVVSLGVLVGQVLSDVTGLPLQGAAVQVVRGTGQATSGKDDRYSIPVNSNHLFLSVSTVPDANAGTRRP